MREIVEHLVLVQSAELAYPVILGADGRVMDGMHRIARALVEGRSHVAAVRFPADPPPDHVGRSPEELAY
ncbi:MAG TPA: hypothetical protein VNF07_09690 [Acidimicrobiales bacterium]|nr:hypothetical protein [Acidimicrobiales bacterium]